MFFFAKMLFTKQILLKLSLTNNNYIVKMFLFKRKIDFTWVMRGKSINFFEGNL